MPKRFLASLIVCVALLTQLGASFWGAAAARDGVAPCHQTTSIDAMAGRADGKPMGAPMGAPAPHDHASCALCQLGFSVVDSAPPIFVQRNVVSQAVVTAPEPDLPAPRAIFNRSAPARAPPSRA